MAGRAHRRFDRYRSYRDWRLERSAPVFFPRMRWNWRRRARNRPSETPFVHLLLSLFILIVMLVSVGSCGLFFVLLFRYW